LPSNAVCFALRVEFAGSVEDIGVDGQHRAVFRALIIVAGNPAEIGGRETFGSHRARAQGLLQGCDGLFAGIETPVGANCELADRPGQGQGTGRLDEDSAVHDFPFSF
jgi:hypothetical protein